MGIFTMVWSRVSLYSSYLVLLCYYFTIIAIIYYYSVLTTQKEAFFRVSGLAATLNYLAGEHEL